MLISDIKDTMLNIILMIEPKTLKSWSKETNAFGEHHKCKKKKQKTFYFSKILIKKELYVCIKIYL